VKTPKGLKFPGGTYISWANQGKELLTSDDVKFLATNITEAAVDASRTKEIFGPTLVYNRSAMEWQSQHAPHLSIKEWIDEQACVVMKNGAPIFSVTRMEYLPKVKSDLFIFQTPVHLQPTEKKVLVDMIKAGEPVAIWGSPAGGIDPEIGALAGLTTKDNNTKAPGRTAKRGVSTLTEGVPDEFPVVQQWTTSQAAQGAEVLYTVNGSPALVLNRTGEKKVQVWDPCEFDLSKIYPYFLVSRGLMQLLGDAHRLTAACDSVIRPLTVHAWQLDDGSIRIMAADTEEGLDDSAETARGITLTLPQSWPQSFTEVRRKDAAKAVDGKLRIELRKSEAHLYQSRID
jgi:hypothetical protein